MKLGRNKFARQTSFENSATTVDELLDDAAFFEFTLLDLLGEIVYSTGPSTGHNCSASMMFVNGLTSLLPMKRKRSREGGAS